MVQTYIVAGGYDRDYLSSTELLQETSSAWTLAGELPSPRLGLRAANIDKKIVMTGNSLGKLKNMNRQIPKIKLILDCIKLFSNQ